MRLSFGCFLSTALILVLGCGKSAPSVQLAPVSGNVKMDGKPLAKATVLFHPESSDGTPVDSEGITDDQGNYTLKTYDGRAGAVVGKHKVSISQIDRERKGKGGINAVPDKYNSKSTLSWTVTAEGATDANFPITSK